MKRMRLLISVLTVYIKLRHPVRSWIDECAQNNHKYENDNFFVHSFMNVCNETKPTK